MAWPYDDGPMRPQGGGLDLLPWLLAQAEPSPKSYLEQRDYDRGPAPMIEQPQIMTEQMQKMIMDYKLPRIRGLIKAGVPHLEAWDLVNDMPDVQHFEAEVMRKYNQPSDLPNLLREFNK